MRALFVVALLSAGLIGCESPLVVDRHTRLVSMSVAEAAQITDAQARLRRQLNLADRQLDDDHAAEARQTLAAAAQTMADTDPASLPTRIRVAGWVGVSELSRRAKDPAQANAACDRAVATLRALSPLPERAEYAVGVANEVRELRGKPAAAKLLVESATWAALVKYPDRRRRALKEVANALFDCDDYADGLGVLRTDPDPAWRSDALASLADWGREMDWASSVGNAAVPGSMAVGRITTTGPVEQPFGKAVDFRSVFGSDR